MDGVAECLFAKSYLNEFGFRFAIEQFQSELIQEKAMIQLVHLRYFTIWWGVHLFVMHEKFAERRNCAIFIEYIIHAVINLLYTR